MSILARLLARLGRLLPAACRTPHPDQMSVRDWADLPAYHPCCE